MSAPRLLDLFCGAGGAAMGYSRAGFDVVGVDIEPQPNYPFEFHQGDVTEVVFNRNQFNMTGCVHLGQHGPCLGKFDALHASPPCQRWSAMTACRPGLGGDYPDLIEPTRNLFRNHPKRLPWVIENVPGAPLDDPVTLCGVMFGQELYRHRLFECSFPADVPRHPAHVMPASRAGHWTPGTVMSVSGHIAPVAHARRVMGIDWTNREELAEAIPPAYTEFIGTQLLAQIRAAAPQETR